MSVKNAQTEDHYGIGAVARLTGLTDHTIRVWERRYQAVVAQRAANGRRVYSAADVEKLALLKRLTDEGLAIGQIAGSTTAELRERARDMGQMGSTTTPAHISVAVLGDFLPGQLGGFARRLAPVDVGVANTSWDRVVTDVSGQTVDVMIMESPVLDTDTTARLIDLMAKAGAERGVLVYRFGRDRDVEAAGDARVVALRAPASIEDIRAAVIRAYTPAESLAPADDEAATKVGNFESAGPIAPRRFNQQQLATLAQTSTAIDCECPHHLAQLVNDLSAFEIYSANCANRDEDDAALHAYLHHTTAEARALIELALEKVARAEGLTY